MRSNRQRHTRREFLQYAGCFGAGAGLSTLLATDGTADQPDKHRTLGTSPRDPDAPTVPVLGIPEWMCWPVHERGWTGRKTVLPGSDKPEVIDRCIDVHQAAGINQLVWNCGRSVVCYNSELPNTTRYCESSDLINGKSWAFMRELMKKCCPLRRAIRICRERGIGILGRLCMNHHYGYKGTESLASRFAQQHPEYHERGKAGGRISNRLCYAIPEVQQERLDILLEIQRLGPDGLVLDFCRQMPILHYHEALVKPYIESRGQDPRKIDSDNPADYMDWFQYRADVLTGFLARLRREVRKQQQQLGRPCSIIARVPASAPWLMIAYGLDIERWCKDDLVDGTMLSPFPHCRNDLKHYPEHHVKVAHGHGKICIGGVGTWGLLPNAAEFKDMSRWQPPLRPAYELAARQYSAGVDAMSLYQTETTVRMPPLQDMIRQIGNKQTVKQRSEELPDYTGENRHCIGCDWHSVPKGQECLRVARCGNSAL